MRTAALISILLLLPAATAAVDTPDDAPTTLVAPAADDALARELVRSFERATAVNDADGDKVFDDLEGRFAAIPMRSLSVIVTLVDGADVAEALEASRDAAGPFEPTHVFDVFGGFAAQLDIDQVQAIAELDIVRQVEYNHPAIMELDTATVFQGADIAVDELGVTGDRDGNETTYTPDDVVIAILDTGFDGKHEDLDEGKIIHFNDCAGEDDEAYDSGSHGTHVASIAAGTGDASDGKYRGVAPGAAIVGIKISGSGCNTAADTVAGYEWIVENKDEYGIDVSTISFGFGTATDGTSAIELALDQVWDAGVVNFKSTGNSGPERRTITIPAASRGILATGAMLDPGDGSDLLAGAGAGGVVGPVFGFSLAQFSSRGPTTDGRVKPDLAAPGVSITAASAGSGDGYVSLSGTSMASPFAAGSAALVLDANPELTPDEVRDLLRSTAEDWGIEGPDVDYGWGRIQVAQAVAAAAAQAGTELNVTSPIVPFHETRAGMFTIDGVTIPPEPSAPAVAEATVEVEATELPFAVTAITEGILLEIVVEDPDGNVVASLSPTNPAARQHQVGFAAEATGEYTVRLVGEPGAAWVFDVAHGTAGGVPIDLPVGDLVEAIGPQSESDDDGNGVPGPALVAVIALLGLAAVAVRRW